MTSTTPRTLKAPITGATGYHTDVWTLSSADSFMVAFSLQRFPAWPSVPCGRDAVGIGPICLQVECRAWWPNLALIIYAYFVFVLYNVWFIGAHHWCGLVAWHCGGTQVFCRQTFPVLYSTLSWRMTTYTGKPSIRDKSANQANLRLSSFQGRYMSSKLQSDVWYLDQGGAIWWMLTGWRRGVAGWGGGVFASCTVGLIVR